ncbi:SnoaL-like domain-containing protein [Larkinella sp. VNQ87]|uniref:SnoaL-like domain-containing protein n=1 Tax=Larkinella sp. VNQ87 TaxID=3400921 RepID=UPI003C075E75
MSEQQIATAVSELVSLATAGNWEAAFEKYYHEKLEKTDLDGVPVQGKAQNLENGQVFASKISNVRDFSSPGSIVKGNRSFVVWSFDFDIDGAPFQVVEVAIQDWEDGQIIRERFSA